MDELLSFKSPVKQTNKGSKSAFGTPSHSVSQRVVKQKKHTQSYYSNLQHQDIIQELTKHKLQVDQKGMYATQHFENDKNSAQIPESSPRKVGIADLVKFEPEKGEQKAFSDFNDSKVEHIESLEEYSEPDNEDMERINENEDAKEHHNDDVKTLQPSPQKNDGLKTITLLNEEERLTSQKLSQRIESKGNTIT